MSPLQPFIPSFGLPGEVSQHLERITVAVLSQELLTKSALEMALLPILQGTWEEDGMPCLSLNQLAVNIS